MQVKPTSNEFFPFYGHGGCHMQEQPVGGGQTLGALNYLGSRLMWMNIIHSHLF
jgi:hypothetical protein